MKQKIIAAMKKYDALLSLLSLLLVFGCLLRVADFHNAAAVSVDSPTGDEISLPILMYHSVLKDPKYQGKYVVSPQTFENDLKYITENGYTTVVVQDLLDYVQKGTPLPEKPVMITFDDGYYNNYLYAYPLLEQYQCKAVISVIGAYSEKFSQSEDFNAYYSHLSWDQIREMQQSGWVEIQNHSYNLHLKSSTVGAKKLRGESFSAYQNRLKTDLEKCQMLLRDNAGISPTAFTYPFGAVSNDSVQILKDAGFSATLSCEEKINRISRDPECLIRLGRFLRPSGKSSEDFFLKILPAEQTFSRK